MAIKLGAEDKKKVILAIVLAVVVLFLAVYTIFFGGFGGGTAPPPLPPQVAQTVTVPTQTAQTAGTQPGAQNASDHEAVKVSGSLMHLDPTLHPEWMAAAESLKYHGNGRNIFSMSSAPVQIEAPKGPIRPNSQPTVAQGPPPPPPVDLKFYGFESHAGSAPKAFLLHGDDIFIASVGDVVDHRYKIVSIAPMSIQVQDIPYNDTQTLPLIQQ